MTYIVKRFFSTRFMWILTTLKQNVPFFNLITIEWWPDTFVFRSFLPPLRGFRLKHGNREFNIDFNKILWKEPYWNTSPQDLYASGPWDLFRSVLHFFPLVAQRYALTLSVHAHCQRVGSSIPLITLNKRLVTVHCHIWIVPWFVLSPRSL